MPERPGADLRKTVETQAQNNSFLSLCRAHDNGNNIIKRLQNYFLLHRPGGGGDEGKSDLEWCNETSAVDTTEMDNV